MYHLTLLLSHVMSCHVVEVRFLFLFSFANRPVIIHSPFFHIVALLAGDTATVATANAI